MGHRDLHQSARHRRPGGGCARSDRSLPGFFADIDETFSTFKPLSEVTFYRSGLERVGRQSREFEHVMSTCRRIRTLTRGAFDPWCVPGGDDPSGYVKGWGAGRASERFVPVSRITW